MQRTLRNYRHFPPPTQHPPTQSDRRALRVSHPALQPWYAQHASAAAAGSRAPPSTTHPQKPYVLKGHERSLTHVMYNKGGDLLFTCSKDNAPNVWFSDDGSRLGTYNGHAGTVWNCDVTGAWE